MTRRPRLAVTLGDPRGIGPDIVAAALADGLDADVTLLGAREQIDGIPADHRIPTGPWHPGKGRQSRDASERRRNVPVSLARWDAAAVRPTPRHRDAARNLSSGLD